MFLTSPGKLSSCLLMKDLSEARDAIEIERDIYPGCVERLVTPFMYKHSKY